MLNIKHLEDFEITKLFAIIHDKRDKALFTLILHYGLRVSEAQKLKVDSIRFQDKRINIIASKNGQSGEQFLSKESATVLKAWLKLKDENYKLAIEKNRTLPRSKQLILSDQEYIFTSKKGGVISTVQIFRLFRKYCLKCKIPIEKAHPHALRHTIAMIMSEKGCSIEETGAHLRHSNISSTKVYYGVTERRRLKMQESLLEDLKLF